MFHIVSVLKTVAYPSRYVSFLIDLYENKCTLSFHGIDFILIRSLHLLRPHIWVYSDEESDWISIWEDTHK